MNDNEKGPGRGAGYIDISVELLADALAMPDGSKIAHAWPAGAAGGGAAVPPGCIRFLVYADGLPECTPDQAIPLLSPIVRETGERPPRHWLNFDWNIQGD